MTGMKVTGYLSNFTIMPHPKYLLNEKMYWKWVPDAVAAHLLFLDIIIHPK